MPRVDCVALIWMLNVLLGVCPRIEVVATPRYESCENFAPHRSQFSVSTFLTSPIRSMIPILALRCTFNKIRCKFR